MYNWTSKYLQVNTLLNLLKIYIHGLKCTGFRVLYLLEDLYNVQLLIQYGASVFILCSLCYIIPLVDNVGEFICSFIFLSATLGEIFVFTYCSQTLSLEVSSKVQYRIVPAYNNSYFKYFISTLTAAISVAERQGRCLRIKLAQLPTESKTKLGFPHRQTTETLRADSWENFHLRPLIFHTGKPTRSKSWITLKSKLDIRPYWSKIKTIKSKLWLFFRWLRSPIRFIL